MKIMFVVIAAILASASNSFAKEDAKCNGLNPAVYNGQKSLALSLPTIFGLKLKADFERALVEDETFKDLKLDLDVFYIDLEGQVVILQGADGQQMRLSLKFMDGGVALPAKEVLEGAYTWADASINDLGQCEVSVGKKIDSNIRIYLVNELTGENIYEFERLLEIKNQGIL